MSNDTVVSLAAPARVSDPLTELLRTGARRLIEGGGVGGVRGVPVRVRPGAAARRGASGWFATATFRNARFSPAWARWTCGCPRHAAARVRPSRSALRWCLPTFGAAQASMRRFRGCTCTGCPLGRCVRRSPRWWARRAPVGCRPNVVSRLKRSWDEEYRQWCRRRLDDEWVYLWADGIYSGLRGEHERLCVLVSHGVNARGEKHFLAIEGRGARVHPELARGAAGDEAARLHAPGEARRGRRGTGVSGRRCRRCIQRPERSAAGCTRPGTS